MTVSASVILWTACPDDLAPWGWESLPGCLSLAERSRLERSACGDAWRQYLVAHVLLRVTLSSLFPVEPAAWRFGFTRHGQPFIQQPEIIRPPFFSLSHTRSLVACAVSLRARVGMDVERMSAGIELDDLGGYVLAEGEHAWWQRQPVEVRLLRFYQFWTLKEAFLKGVGRGLGVSPASLAFELSGGGPPQLLHIPAGLGSVDEWSFRLLEPTPEHTSALALNIRCDEPMRVRVHHAGVSELISSMGCGV